MIVYVEGVDGSGKTTLINNLAKKLIDLGYNVEVNAENFIPTRPNNGWRIEEDEMYSTLYGMLESDRIFFLDRGPISDIVYRVFDDYEPVTTYNKIRKWIKLHNNIMVIYCRTDKAKENMIKRGDDNPVSLARHNEISKVYDLVMENIPHYIYDMSLDNINIVVDIYIETIKTMCKMGE